MSTPYRIVVEKPDHTFDSIYVHFSGHLDIAGTALLKNYTDSEKVSNLIDLGNLSVLDTSTDCPEGHSFEHPVKGYCIAYGRDRGEHDSAARRGQKVIPTDKQYTYLFKNDDKHWYVMANESKGVLLTSELIASYIKNRESRNREIYIFKDATEVVPPVANNIGTRIRIK
jgi:hypothetical protein